ncbi:hypothetical protein [Streptomyces sp. NPDC059639]|uniref:hypothetical protein n=1 Tax=Streptomyces sp. NPDC059639 TaxID=3346891 RepID=UPI0036AAE74F
MPYYTPPPPGFGTKPPGKARRIWGIVILVVGVLPLLAGAAVFAANVKDGRITQFNDAYAPKAWHNLRSDVLFPDKLSDVGSRLENPGWVRQGIAKPAQCDEVLSGKLRQQATDGGCKTVLRATYVDNGGEAAATVSLIVLRDSAAAKELSDQYVDVAETAGPTVKPYPVPKTEASSWSKSNALAGYITQMSAGTSPTPYVLALSTGPLDPERSWGQLPAPWKFAQESEVRAYERLTGTMARIAGGHINEVIRWGVPTDDA